MISECVTNAGKHSAGTRVNVNVEQRDDDILQISVIDDGRGFSSERVVVTDELPQTQGWGLRLLFAHVLQVGGHVHLRSEPGTGTTIELLLPVREPVRVQL